MVYDSAASRFTESLEMQVGFQETSSGVIMWRLRRGAVPFTVGHTDDGALSRVWVDQRERVDRNGPDLFACKRSNQELDSRACAVELTV
jgi:hypothetical protein